MNGENSQPESERELPESSAAAQADAGFDAEGRDGRQLNIPKTVCATLFWLICAGALLFGCFVSFFSYPAMRMYDNMGLKRMALSRAETYLSRHADEYGANTHPAYDSKYADALLYAVRSSVYFMNDAIDSDGYDSALAKKFAEKADKHITEYLLYSTDNSMQRRSLMIDMYAKNTYAAMPSLHPPLYSFSQSIAVSRFRAQYVLGDEKKMTRFIESVTNQMTGDGWQNSTDDAFWQQHFLLYACLNDYITCELDRLDYYKYVPKGALVAGDSTAYENAVEQNVKYRSITKLPFSLLIEARGYTSLYNLLSDGFAYSNAYIRDNAQDFAAVDTAEKLLPYANRLYITKEFMLNMYDLSLVLSNNSAYYDYAMRENLRNLWLNSEWYRKGNVSNVWYVESGIVNEGEHSTAHLEKWYARGILYRYILLYNG